MRFVFFRSKLRGIRPLAIEFLPFHQTPLSNWPCLVAILLR
ncbi:hypothetical protein [Piscirickettsia salmonis]|nr:hypothetical protein [Piscirickettsia salmonis]